MRHCLSFLCYQLMLAILSILLIRYLSFNQQPAKRDTVVGKLQPAVHRSFILRVRRFAFTGCDMSALCLCMSVCMFVSVCLPSSFN